MQTENRITIYAPAARVYDLAARIERWPRILPHYRSVTILREDGEDRRLAEMAATRDGIPVSWVSIQELDPARHGIRFRHVRGATRGMDVEWIIEPLPGADALTDGAANGASSGDASATLVRIVHLFDPPWPRPLGPLVARYVVGDFFVHDIANKTLRRIKELAEVESRKSEVESNLPTGGAPV